jgi:hypothetical protein
MNILLTSTSLDLLKYRLYCKKSVWRKFLYFSISFVSDNTWPLLLVSISFYCKFIFIKRSPRNVPEYSFGRIIMEPSMTHPNKRFILLLTCTKQVWCEAEILLSTIYDVSPIGKNPIFPQLQLKCVELHRFLTVL